MNRRLIRARTNRRGRSAFVLLEVIVSLTILTITVGVILRSFSQSMSAARQLEARTQALFFARQLMDEFEIRPPDEGFREGGFGDDYYQYSYTAEVTYEEPDYRGVDVPREVEQLYLMRNLKIDIYYNDGRHAPFIAASAETAIMGFERFSEQAKRQRFSGY